MALNIDDARTGAISVQQDPPAYPRDQAMRGVQAHVVVLVKTDGTGKVASATIGDYQGSNTASRSRQDFEAASLKAVESWTYRTEQVGGNGLATTLRVPISFCLADKWCERNKIKDDTAPPTATPPGMAMAIDSVVRIKTRTSQTEI
jgi:TonB family protein